ncbi:EscU/YscU/HrcU family type III secretion system export apparatus switch protein, partial [Zoogloea sp.]|uniref:EscU/YscU/HrcU family type III secretion system export apparatus switch protein n=1 Tax=Zoogloea sp. TaxID=49181 RepID=UPI002630D364
MAEDSDLEKSEPASGRRLEQAREEGQVPQSRELATFMSLMAAVAVLYMLGAWGGQRLLGVMREALSFPRDMAFDTRGMGGTLLELAIDGLLTAGPLMLVVVLAAFAPPFLMGGWVFSTKSLQFNPSRLNPLA